jgi:hypothetical protein
MDMDRLNMVAPRDVLETAYSLITTAQDHPPHLAIAAIALLIHEISIQLRLPKGELMDKAERMAGDMHENYITELRALRQFIREELK